MRPPNGRSVRTTRTSAGVIYRIVGRFLGAKKFEASDMTVHCIRLCTEARAADKCSGPHPSMRIQPSTNASLGERPLLAYEYPGKATCAKANLGFDDSKRKDKSNARRSRIPRHSFLNNFLPRSHLRQWLPLATSNPEFEQFLWLLCSALSRCKNGLGPPEQCIKTRVARPFQPYVMHVKP